MAVGDIVDHWITSGSGSEFQPSSGVTWHIRQFTMDTTGTGPFQGPYARQETPYVQFGLRNGTGGDIAFLHNSQTYYNYYTFSRTSGIDLYVTNANPVYLSRINVSGTGLITGQVSAESSGPGEGKCGVSTVSSYGTYTVQPSSGETWLLTHPLLSNYWGPGTNTWVYGPYVQMELYNGTSALKAMFGRIQYGTMMLAGHAKIPVNNSIYFRLTSNVGASNPIGYSGVRVK